MIKFIKKDVTDVCHGIIAHGVNCQGKMASGVAKVIRAKWVGAYDQYLEVCKFYEDDRANMLGMLHLVDVGQVEGELYVANCFTQEYYGKDGKKYANLGAVKDCLLAVLESAVGFNLPVYLPRIGCGLGGLDWETEVGPALEEAYQTVKDACAGDIDPQVFVCDL